MSLATVDTYDSPQKGVYCLIGGVFVFSLQDVIIKLLSGTYPVHQIVLLRSCFSIVPLLVYCYLEGGLHLLRTGQIAGHVLRSAFMFGSFLCLYLALAALPLAETVSLSFTSPIFITILSVIILREKVSLGRWVAVLVGFLGVVVMLRPGSDLLDPAAVFALMTALLYGTSSIITRKLGKRESGLSLAFYSTVMYTIFSAALSIGLSGVAISEGSHPSYAFLLRSWCMPTPGDLLLLVTLGFIAATGFYLLSQAYRLAAPSSIASFEYVAVPLGVIWGHVFWKDVPDLTSFVGMLLIIGSGVYIFRSKKMIKRSVVPRVPK